MKHLSAGVAAVALFSCISFTSITFAAEPITNPQQPSTASQQDPNFVDVQLSDINGQKVNAKLSKDDLKKLKLQPGAAFTLIALPGAL